MLDLLPEDMVPLLIQAAHAVRQSKRVYAFSHIDADGISALAIVATILERENKEFLWKNVHQINSESIEEVREDVQEYKPDLVIFSDFGTGQVSLIRDRISDIECVDRVIILDHHLPQDDSANREPVESEKIVEINPAHHGISGSYELSGAGTAFLLAMALSPSNVDLSELAIVGATGDLQDYYGKGFTGINRAILEAGEQAGHIRVTRDLTFFGINTRPLPYLLQYATDPYLPGITGVEEECFAFFDEAGVKMKNDVDEWRVWVDLEPSEKQAVVQMLIREVLESYDDERVAQGLVGDVIILTKRPERTDMRSAKEFSTLLNACGRNRRPDVGVRVCLGDQDAITEGRALLVQHRANLAMALRRLESDGFSEREGMYLVDDPETPETIIGIVIGMAQGARIIPINKPIIGVSRNTPSESQFVKISGRAHKYLVDRGLNLKEVFVEVADILNEKAERPQVEAGGHPMAAGAFVRRDRLDTFLDMISERFASIVN